MRIHASFGLSFGLTLVKRSAKSSSRMRERSGVIVYLSMNQPSDKYLMTNIPGTNVSAPIVPQTSADTYPTHDSRWGRGGWKAASTIADRDAIPLERLEDGAIVYVVATRTSFVWVGGSWIEFVTGDPATATALTNEVAARQAADVGLGQRITDEATARSAAVSTLTTGAATLATNAAAETTARQAADAALGQRVTDETTARSAADAALQDNMDIATISSAAAILNLQAAFIQRLGYK